MKCQQCTRPAFAQVGEGSIPLCLDCYHKLAEATHWQFLQNAAMMNQAMDHMDMVVGIGPTGGRIPVAEMAMGMQKRGTFNNITIANSQVGVVSTGDLAKIDAAITLTRGSDAELVGQQIKLLTQAILDTRDMAASTRQELLDLVQSLAEQIVAQRKPSVVKALLGSISEKAGGFASLAKIAADLASVVGKLFGGPEGLA
ncbi:MAG TPA: hypothetical protein VF601_12260 [Beijerinckiaceae bacterium]|jgi:hypothetical protein